MKRTMKNLIVLTIFLTKVCISFAAIPTVDFILKKSSGTTGRQIVAIDQDVFFKVDQEEAVVSEHWLIEGDRNMKLSAVAQGLLKENLQLNFLYNNKVKTHLITKVKQSEHLSPDFFQKYLFIRSLDSFKNYLNDLSIAPQARLSRADSRVVYAIGNPSDSHLNPQFWIDQDEFVVRKIRLPSGIEVQLSDVAQISPDLYIAKTQTITWPGVGGQAGGEIKIKVKNINTKTGSTLQAFYPQNFTQPSQMAFANRTPLTELVEYFYKRLR